MSSGASIFMPMNVALTWWEHFKKHRYGFAEHLDRVAFTFVPVASSELRRPRLGVEVSSFYTLGLEFLEMITWKFPNTSEGVFVHKVIPGSSACAAGFDSCDVIIKFGGKAVGNVLELLKESWNRDGESVEVVVIRKSSNVPVHMTMVVEEATPDQFYKWKLWPNAP